MKKLALAGSLIVSFFASTCTYAANFQLFEQSATELGVADAGTGVSDDPSVQYYNPAATAFFNHTAVGASGIAILPSINFNPKSATNFAGDPITGTDSSPARNAFIPAGYYIQPLNQHWVVGMGMTVPFGLATSYDNDSMARYFATRSKIETINLNPSLAYRFSDAWSLGVGFDAQYMQATLNQAFDYQTADPFATSDAYVKNTANDWGYGWNVGINWRPTDTTKIGLSYRSQIRHHLKGDSTVTGVPDDAVSQDIAGYLGLVDSKVSGDITLPAYTTLSADQAINSRWHVMGDAAFINWNVIQQITLNFSPKADNITGRVLSPATIPLHYHNTWRLALGQSYEFNRLFTGRMGVAYDESPLKKAYATARIPDSNRYWFTLGLGCHVSQKAEVDFGYAHIFFKNSSVDQSEVTPFGTANLNAKYTAYANLFGMQFNYRFG